MRLVRQPGGAGGASGNTNEVPGAGRIRGAGDRGSVRGTVVLWQPLLLANRFASLRRAPRLSNSSSKRSHSARICARARIFHARQWSSRSYMHLKWIVSSESARWISWTERRCFEDVSIAQQRVCSGTSEVLYFVASTNDLRGSGDLTRTRLVQSLLSVVFIKLKRAVDF